MPLGSLKTIFMLCKGNPQIVESCAQCRQVADALHRMWRTDGEEIIKVVEDITHPLPPTHPFRASERCPYTSPLQSICQGARDRRDEQGFDGKPVQCPLSPSRLLDRAVTSARLPDRLWRTSESTGLSQFHRSHSPLQEMIGPISVSIYH